MTGFNSNIDELIEKFKGIKERASNINVVDALTAGVNAARGEMSFRIFNEGLDTNGNPLGPYKGRKTNFAKVPSRPLSKQEEDLGTFLFGNQKEFTEYELKRLKAGRQVRYKDLEFTGTLRRGVVVITESEKKVVCAIPSQRNWDIVVAQEEYLQVKIFGLSASELETMRFNTMEILKQIYVRVFNP